MYKDTYLYLNKANYSDVFTANFISKKHISVEEIAATIFELPLWVEFLLYVRDRMVSVFGLRISKAQNGIDNLKSRKCIEGDIFGMFMVVRKTENFIIFSEKDKHLDFILIITKKQNGLNYLCSVETIVQYNNWLGRVYFFFVKPFHKLIVEKLINKLNRSFGTRV